MHLLSRKPPNSHFGEAVRFLCARKQRRFSKLVGQRNEIGPSKGDGIISGAIFKDGDSLRKRHIDATVYDARKSWATLIAFLGWLYLLCQAQ